MIRAALIALALCAPAYAATTDLTLTLIDGRPAFRPADGLDCWSSKFGGQAIDCVLLDASLVRPKRAPCWLRDYPDRPCPVSPITMAALPPMPVERHVETIHERPVFIGAVKRRQELLPEHPVIPLPSVPLPGSGALMAAIVAMALWGRRRV